MKSGLIKVETVNLRDFGTGNYRQLDDYVFGSGGMLFAAPQLKKAVEFVSEKTGISKPFIIFPSPQGVLLSQEIIESVALQEHVIILCGHYEGIDERFIKSYVDLEISIGDCVLTGGEIPAMTIVDSVSRLVPGVVGRGEAVIEDSFYRGMLDHPNYTRPFEWEGMKVPEVLLSGDAKKISIWRRKEAVKRTLTRRPDLISRAAVGDYICDGIYLAVVAEEKTVNYLSDILNLCRTYDLKRPLIISDSYEIRKIIKDFSCDFKVLGNFNRVIDLTGENTLVIKIFLEKRANSLHSLEIKRRCLEHNGPILFLFSEKDKKNEENEENENIKNIEVLKTYLYDKINIKLPLNIIAAISIDRFLGKR